MSLITIDQLLESVDLDFEPRWVTKDKSGSVCLYEHKPKKDEKHKCWLANHFDDGMAEYINLKLAEFEGKDWTECIYEVPRKTTGKIEKINKEKFNFVYSRKEKNDIESALIQILDKQAELVDAVNELKVK